MRRWRGTQRGRLGHVAASGESLISGDGSLTLVWSKPLASDFDHVIVLRSDADNVANERSVYQGAAFTYRDTGLTNGKTYRYVIRSIDTAGNRSVGRGDSRRTDRAAAARPRTARR